MASRLTVLLVEDEWLIAASTTEGLSRAGFDVIEVTRADEALAILEDKAAIIAAVVTDVRLSGPMCGITLAQHVARCWPWLALIIASGENEERLAARPAGCAANRKPYDSEQVVAELNVMLASRGVKLTPATTE